MLLCHICSRWRTAALATPGLWASLFIFSYSSFRTERNIPLGKPAASLVKQWFLRAGNSRALSLGLGHVRDRVAFWELADKVIFTYASRWRHLQLHSSWTRVLMPFFRLPPYRVTQLEVLKLKLEDTVDLGITAFQMSPRLRCVEISGLNNLIHEYFLPWQQLTHLAIHGPLTPAIFAAVFSRCLSLQKGIFVIIFGSHDLTSDEDVILPALCDLDITMKNRQHFGFEGFNFPNLRKFRFHDHDRDIGNLLIPTLSIHFLGQLHSLQSLSIVNSWSPEGILRLLDNTPLLVVLELDVAPDSHDFWEGLIWDPQSGRSLVPRLRELDIHFENFGDQYIFLDKTITDIVSSRETRQVDSSHVHADPIRRVSVTVYPGKGGVLTAIERMFRKCGGLGVELHLKTAKPSCAV
jgi:hypothetical protein